MEEAAQPHQSQHPCAAGDNAPQEAAPALFFKCCLRPVIPAHVSRDLLVLGIICGRRCVGTLPGGQVSRFIVGRFSSTKDEM